MEWWAHCFIHNAISEQYIHSHKPSSEMSELLPSPSAPGKQAYYTQAMKGRLQLQLIMKSLPISDHDITLA